MPESGILKLAFSTSSDANPDTAPEKRGGSGGEFSLTLVHTINSFYFYSILCTKNSKKDDFNLTVMSLELYIQILMCFSREQFLTICMKLISQIKTLGRALRASCFMMYSIGWGDFRCEYLTSNLPNPMDTKCEPTCSILHLLRQALTRLLRLTSSKAATSSPSVGESALTQLCLQEILCKSNSGLTALCKARTMQMEFWIDAVSAQASAPPEAQSIPITSSEDPCPIPSKQETACTSTPPKEDPLPGTCPVSSGFDNLCLICGANFLMPEDLLMHLILFHNFTIQNDENEAKASRRPFSGLPPAAAEKIRAGRIQKGPEGSDTECPTVSKKAKKPSKTTGF